MTIRVVLAEDHELMRAGLRALLATAPNVEVVGEAANGRDVLGVVASTRPNVVVMDIAMPELSGLEATVRLRAEHPAARVLILSMHANEEYVLRALKAGASGYLLKNAGADELVRAIVAVAAGEAYFSPAISRKVLDDYVRRVSAAGADPLTSRQREILQLVAEGRSTKEIASRLGLSVKTVESHRSEIMQRLDVHDVAGLVRYAVRAGLVGVDS